MAFDVFLCHNNQDEAAARDLAGRLRSAGIEPWLFEEQLRPGQRWQKELERQIETIGAAIVCVGEAGIGPWQDQEIDAFLRQFVRRGSPIIPVLLSTCRDSPKLPLFLEGIQCVDFRREEPDPLGLLVWGIAGSSKSQVPPKKVVYSRRWQKLAVRYGAVVSILSVVTAAVIGLLEADIPTLQLVARDTADRPVENLRFSYLDEVSLPTSKVGWTTLVLPPESRPGDVVKIRLVGSHDDWLLLNPQINIPSPAASAEAVLVPPSQVLLIAAEVRERNRWPTGQGRGQIVSEVAERFSLGADRLNAALQILAESNDPIERGISAYLRGDTRETQEILGRVALEAQDNLLEVFRYLGAAQHQEGNFKEAAITFRKALLIGGEDTCLLGWLGSTLTYLGEYAEAEILLNRAVAISERSFGPDHPDVAANLVLLGRLFGANDRRIDAERALRRAIGINEAIKGPEDPIVLRDSVELAWLFYRDERYVESEQLWRRTLFTAERKVDTDPRISTYLSGLAQTLAATGRVSEAEALLRRALEIDEVNFGPVDPRLANNLNSLAKLLKESNRAAEAEPFIRRGLDLAESFLEPDSPCLAGHLDGMGLVLQALGRFDEAEAYFQRALQIEESSSGKNSLDYGIMLHHWARLLRDTGKYAEAKPSLIRAAEILQRDLGPTHMRTKLALADLSSLEQARKASIRTRLQTTATDHRALVLASNG
jgi:tetratricopeptide (TPR) repeat protein